jgi:chromosome segregation protein
LDAAEAALPAAAARLAAARGTAAAAAAEAAKLAAEARALAEVLGVKDQEDWPPMVDALRVPEGLEAALGAALGEELSSAADPAAARHWRGLPPLPAPAALPEGAVRLGALVDAPPVLGRALSQIGLIADDAGAAAQAALAPGQTLVSRSGAVWRWDGYTIRAGAPTAAAVRLAQRNRLTALRVALGEAEAARADSAAARDEAESAERAASAAAQAARAARRAAEAEADRTRAAAAGLRSRADAAAARLAAIAARRDAVAADLAEAELALTAAREAVAALPDIGALRQAVAAARAALAAARAAAATAAAARDALQREAAARTQRLAAIAAEREGWQSRAADAAGRVADLAARLAEAEATQAALAAAPEAAGRARAEAAEALDGADARHRAAARLLAEAEAAGTASAVVARDAAAALAAAREAQVRAEAAAEAADHAWGTVAETILQRLGPAPTLPDLPAGPDAEEKARRKLDRLTREREEMGPVNLRAETEAAEVEAALAALAREREEITTAIARLRGSIGHLNREGRERLAAVFAEVDRHFQTLFARMFGGGRAHLAMVGSDDPLTAGLEIYAQPPGKKLATLSLLSGGEQALTALSLIFAVFRCNPAPIAVLDEVDAPLDDANVDRFCTLLEDMVRDTATRFLVVTHHPLTMARMDRLYGVTMQERGVSRLLAVDLGAAVAMAESALAAE